ncbi:MAG: replication protein [Thermodesulfobacteriota bacterium]
MKVSACEQIQQLGFKPGTQLNIFCPGDSGSIQVFSDKPDEIEIQKFLTDHTGHDCFFGFPDGRKWKIQNDGGIEVKEPQRTEPKLDTEKNTVSPSSTPFKQDVPIETPKAELITLPEGANPQAEDGHVDIANEIVEALAKVNLSAYESRVLWVIWRKTYGWHRKKDQISITQFEKATGLKRWHVARTLSELAERNIVTRMGNSRIITYGFQKDYTKWRTITKRGNDAGISRVSGEGKERIVTRIGNRSLPKGVNTKETNKRNIYVEGSIELRLASLLLEQIQKNKPDFKQPNLQSWAKEVDLMLRRDNRSAEAIERVIRWVQADHGDGMGRWRGWAENILSPRKLREKFDELEMKIQYKPKPKDQGPKYIDGNIREA